MVLLQSGTSIPSFSCFSGMAVISDVEREWVNLEQSEYQSFLKAQQRKQYLLLGELYFLHSVHCHSSYKDKYRQLILCEHNAEKKGAQAKFSSSHTKPVRVQTFHTSGLAQNLNKFYSYTQESLEKLYNDSDTTATSSQNLVQLSLRNLNYFSFLSQHSKAHSLYYNLLCKTVQTHLCVCLFIYLLIQSFCLFLSRSHGIWRFPAQGSNRSCSHQPTPEPQQRGIRAMSATHTTAHGKAGSPTH